MKSIARFAAPIAAMAFGALALGACNNDDMLADNTYSVPSETSRSTPSSDLPSTTPSTPSPGTLGNPETSNGGVPPPILPPNPDDPAAPRDPASPATPLP